MDFANLPIASVPAAPLPAPASVPSAPFGPSAPDKRRPLAQRLTLNPTITAKVNYFDLAQTRRPPFDLRTALIWLCLCAHDNSAWWEPRSPEHLDGEDAPPLPLALNFAAWMRYIHDWQSATFAPHEDQEIEALALRVWIGAHETVCVPEEDAKKNGTPPLPTGVSSTPTSSAAVTAAAALTSSSPCPSEPPMPSFTHGSAPTESPASAQLSPTAETPRLMPSSPPPVAKPFWVAERTEDGSVRYGNKVDEHGFIHCTHSIHEALAFDSEEECASWLRGRRISESFTPREHLIC